MGYGGCKPRIKGIEKLNVNILLNIIILSVQFGLLSGHLLGNSCPLG